MIIQVCFAREKEEVKALHAAVEVVWQCCTNEGMTNAHLLLSLFPVSMVHDANPANASMPAKHMQACMLICHVHVAPAVLTKLLILVANVDRAN